jgi:hypothetical protein
VKAHPTDDNACVLFTAELNNSPIDETHNDDADMLEDIGILLYGFLLPRMKSSQMESTQCMLAGENSIYTLEKEDTCLLRRLIHSIVTGKNT